MQDKIGCLSSQIKSITLEDSLCTFQNVTSATSPSEPRVVFAAIHAEMNDFQNKCEKELEGITEMYKSGQPLSEVNKNFQDLIHYQKEFHTRIRKFLSTL